MTVTQQSTPWVQQAPVKKKRHTLRWVLVGGLVLFGGCGTLRVPTGGKAAHDLSVQGGVQPDLPEHITMAEFTQIQTGMTVQQVQAIVGSQGETSVQDEVAGYTGLILSWEGDSLGGNAMVQFRTGLWSARARRVSADHQGQSRETMPKKRMSVSKKFAVGSRHHVHRRHHLDEHRRGDDKGRRAHHRRPPRQTQLKRRNHGGSGARADFATDAGTDADDDGTIADAFAGIRVEHAHR